MHFTIINSVTVLSEGKGSITEQVVEIDTAIGCHR